MNTYYNVEIQASEKKKITTGIISMFEDFLGITDRDLDEREGNRAVFFFVSDMKPSEVRNRIRTILNQTTGIYYVDIIYRFENEMHPDRVVLWRDGREQEYTGHVMFEEDRA